MSETSLRDFCPHWEGSITQLLQICRLQVSDVHLLGRGLKMMGEQRTHCNSELFAKSVVRDPKSVQNPYPSALHHYQQQQQQQLGQITESTKLSYSNQKLQCYLLEVFVFFFFFFQSNSDLLIWCQNWNQHLFNHRRPNLVNLFCSQLTAVVFCCCSLFASRISMMFVQRWCPAYIWWLFAAFLSFLPILLWHQQGLFSHTATAHKIFSTFKALSVNLRDGCTWSSQQISVVSEIPSPV